MELPPINKNEQVKFKSSLFFLVPKRRHGLPPPVEKFVTSLDKLKRPIHHTLLAKISKMASRRFPRLLRRVWSPSVGSIILVKQPIGRLRLRIAALNTDAPKQKKATREGAIELRTRQWARQGKNLSL